MSLDLQVINAKLDRIATTTENSHKQQVQIRDLNTKLLESVQLLREEISALQRAKSLDRQEFENLRSNLSRIIRIMDRREAIQRNLGSGY